MGTGGDFIDIQGLVPRIIVLIFDEVNKRKDKAEFAIKASFCEIHNEDIHDLLDPNGQNRTLNQKNI